MPAGTERFVRTREIRAVVKGRENDILDALGIAWRNGRPHIACPYPDHDDHNPSWRFDARTGRVFCTCITDRKSDGIFDVIMKMKAVDFDAAKIIVAELLHRNDLVKTKTGNNSGPGQKTDAESLLNPPADNRDDQLVYRYLGARLGIDADQVPRPSTKTVGVASLAYYDPPANDRKNATPVLVGHWPCYVFETVAADGRCHAMRIYVAEGATGKAELGQTAAGKERDPKKSARRQPQGPSTTGCCVIWGNPDVEHLIVAEGIENAAAIAASFRGEIEKGELAVLAAITAGGVEAFTPWPGNGRITIAADRDEGKPGAGFKRGEKAARNLAMRLAAEAKNGGRPIPTLIPLPGDSGTKYDFLDLFLASGADGVRNTILAAQPFQPSPNEIAEFEWRAKRKSELEEITQRYPLPSLIGLRVDYRHTEDGRVWLHKFKGVAEDKETHHHIDSWEAVSSPFGALVQLAMPGHQTAFGLRVHIRTVFGAANAVDFLSSELPKLGASGVRSALMGAGVRVANGGETTIVEILKQAEPNDCIEVIRSFGWHQSKGEIFLNFGGKRWR